MLGCSNVNSAVDIFYENIFKNVDLRCPAKYLCQIKATIYKKKFAHLIYKKMPTQINYNQFSNVRPLC